MIKYSKIWFTGTSSVGKTEQAKFFLENTSTGVDWSMLDFNRRDLADRGIIKLNREASPWDEVVIAGNVMQEILSASVPFISDRSWICKCAYSQCLPFRQELLDALHMVNVNAFPGHDEKDIYFYFPPTLPLVSDGIRSTDEHYRKEVDYFVQWYLDFFEIPFYTITQETIQSRHFEIINVLIA